MTGPIRIAREDDAAAIHAIYAPVVRETHISFELEPPSDEQIRERIRAVLRRAPWLVHETDGQIDGYAYGSPFKDRPAYDWSVEASVYVRADRRRRGVARALLAALLEALANQGYRQAFAVIALPNEASVTLFESFGFQPAGVWRRVGYKLGSWWDVGVWQRGLGTSSEPPHPIRPVTPPGA